MFKDKNGKEIKIGDKIIPDGEGRELLIISKFYVEDYGEECLFGQQILDPMAFSPLTKDNLSKNWILVKE